MIYLSASVLLGIKNRAENQTPNAANNYRTSSFLYLLLAGRLPLKTGRGGGIRIHGTFRVHNISSVAQ